MKFEIDESDKEILLSSNIYSTRPGMNRKFQQPMFRWKNGDEISFDPFCAIEEYSTFAQGNFLFNSGSFTENASVFSQNTHVGRYSCIAVGGKLLNGFRHPMECVSMSSAMFNFARENVYPYVKKYKEANPNVKFTSIPTPQKVNTRIEIGHDVWLASDIMLNPGITIGTGSVICRNAVVMHDVPPYSFVAGFPAKVKKLRFEEAIVKDLLDSKWWDYELGDFYKFKLDLANPKNFLKGFDKYLPYLNKYKPFIFYPFEYLLKRKTIDFFKDMLCTFHGTVAYLLKDDNSYVLRHSDNHQVLADGIQVKCVYEVCTGGYFFQSIINNRPGRFLKFINAFGGIQLSEIPIIYKSKINADKSMTIEIDTERKLNLSARIDGSFALTANDRDWEHLITSAFFANSVLQRNGWVKYSS